MKLWNIGSMQLSLSDHPNYASKDEILSLYWNYHPRFKFFKNIPFKSKLLDIGAGEGGLHHWKEWELPIRNDIEMYAIDIREGKFFPKYVDYQVCDLNRDNIKYSSDYFNVAFLSHVLEHISDEVRLLEEVNRVIKRKGKLYIEIPTPDTLFYPSRDLFIDQGIDISTVNFRDDNTHIKTYNMEELEELLQSTGFKVIEYGVIENKFIEDILFEYGIKNNDSELITYAVWSKLRWAHYIIGEKV